MLTQFPNRFCDSCHLPLHFTVITNSFQKYILNIAVTEMILGLELQW